MKLKDLSESNQNSLGRRFLPRERILSKSKLQEREAIMLRKFIHWAVSYPKRCGDNRFYGYSGCAVPAHQVDTIPRICFPPMLR